MQSRRHQYCVIDYSGGAPLTSLGSVFFQRDTAARCLDCLGYGHLSHVRRTTATIPASGGIPRANPPSSARGGSSRSSNSWQPFPSPIKPQCKRHQRSAWQQELYRRIRGEFLKDCNDGRCPSKQFRRYQSPPSDPTPGLYKPTSEDRQRK